MEGAPRELLVAIVNRTSAERGLVLAHPLNGRIPGVNIPSERKTQES